MAMTQASLRIPMTQGAVSWRGDRQSLRHGPETSANIPEAPFSFHFLFTFFLIIDF